MKLIKQGKTYENKTLNTLQILSRIFSVSERLISEAKFVLKNDNVLFDKVKTGTITLTKAVKEIKDFALMQKGKNIQKPETIDLDIVLSKLDKTRILDFITEFNVSEEKAKQFIIKRKRINQKTRTPKTDNDYKEVKFRLLENDKIELQKKAKQQGLTVSEMIRNMITNII